MHETSTDRPTIADCSGTLRVIPFGDTGRGVAAARTIKSGEVIERVPVIVVPENERQSVDASKVGFHIFMWEHGKVGEDLYSGKGRTAVVLGYSSLINHSSDPNCTFIRYIEAQALELIALRDIAAGEELRFDYHMRLWFDPV